ncbi:MAG TPA: hypothetical protein DIT64_10125 [Verrucomicrobiales bacterium]|nr:hypothetical protein [Verrucomicrobiales bacterium]
MSFTDVLEPRRYEMFAMWQSAVLWWPSSMSAVRSVCFRLRTALMKLAKWFSDFPPSKAWTKLLVGSKRLVSAMMPSLP